jgi:hypothetical protein
MKKPTHVIRVPAPRAHEAQPSLSNWLDAVQVRPSAAEAGPLGTGEARHDGSSATTAEAFSDLVWFKLL